jgi:Ser/Thr protein kinase RdoA (MazF antagonist)
LIKEIRAQFTDTILHEAAVRFGVTGDLLKSLGGFESFVYEYARGDQSYILKIGHTIRRSEHYIMGELEWLNFLADRGVSVARAIPSENGRLIERVPAADGHAWLVMAYAKAPGHLVTAEDWNGQFYETLGRLTGQMHRLTKEYRLSNPAFKRQEWYEEDQLNARKYLPAHEAAVIARADELMAELRTLPAPPDAFGMMHTDLHHGNVFVHEGQITAFDFDDCHWSYFVNDAAVTRTGALWFPPAPHADRKAFAQEFLTHYFRGYCQENRLDPKWLPHIRDFLLLRDLLLFITIYQSFDVAGFSEKQVAELNEHRRRVLQGEPIVDLDWMQFAMA